MAEIEMCEKRCQKLLKWIRENRGFWYLICTPDKEEMNIKVMVKIIECLDKAELYELVIVLLAVHRNEPYIEYMIPNLGLELMYDKLENTDMKKITKTIRNLLE